MLKILKVMSAGLLVITMVASLGTSANAAAFKAASYTKAHNPAVTDKLLAFDPTGTTNSSIILNPNGQNGTVPQTTLTPNPNASLSNPSSLVGSYITVNAETRLINNPGEESFLRVAFPGKYYQVKAVNNNNVLISIGRISGYLPLTAVANVSPVSNEKVTMAWDYVNTRAKNILNYDQPTDTVNIKSKDSGFDVLSPTWFGVTGYSTKASSIAVTDMADLTYSNIAHKNGYLIWARLCEMDKKRAALMFSNSAARQKVMTQTIAYAKKYDIDGINIDFEALGSANKNAFSNFMRDFYPLLKANNLFVTIDVTKISATSDLYSLCYDRPVLANYSDCLALMAYDEHYSSSKTPGSVGSYPWVVDAIKGLINQGVPTQKIMLCVPFYLRDFSVTGGSGTSTISAGDMYKAGTAFKFVSSDSKWYTVNYNGLNLYIGVGDAVLAKANTPPSTTQSAVLITSVEGTMGTTITPNNNTLPFDSVVLTKDASVYITKPVQTTSLGNPSATGSSAVSIMTAADRLSTYKGSIIDDPSSKQKVLVYYKSGVKHMIWLETADSMGWRMDLVKQYNLCGAAGWSLLWKPTPDIIDTIKLKLKTN